MITGERAALCCLRTMLRKRSSVALEGCQLRSIASLNFTDSLGIIFETHEIHLRFSKNVKLHNYSVVLL
jgi:hypothetical protein